MRTATTPWTFWASGTARERRTPGTSCERRAASAAEIWSEAGMHGPMLADPVAASDASPYESLTLARRTSGEAPLLLLEEHTWHLRAGQHAITQQGAP
mmetsp:Transcript_2838/g.6735  ORF Transcript_2838/g.6735 Transcript_2838/m.6735 type:complete len:98 (+) Transcript_2838:620-913(+)